MNETLLLGINQGWAHPWLDVFFHWISQRASFSFPLLGLLLVFFSWHFKQDGAKLWLMLVLMIGVGDGLGNIIKHSTDQLRPCSAQPELVRQIGAPPNTPCGTAPNGMPSNHALNFFATAIFLSLVMRSWAWSTSLFTLALLVSISRIYLGKHYPLQVLTGATIGTILGFLGAWIGLKYLGFMQRIQAQTTLRTTKPYPMTPSEPTMMAAAPVHPCTAEVPEMQQQFLAHPPTARAPSPHRLSIVIPMYNEELSVAPMTARVHEVLKEYAYRWELILVNDGSADNTEHQMKHMQQQYGAYVRVVNLQRNFGQTAAMQAGIDAARGDIIAMLDGDLQNDPIDIPRMVERLINEDLDLVSGWRKDRKDGLWLRKVPSWIANRLIGRITHVHLHDYGCSLKVFRAHVLKSVRLYGEMHRFIPAWLASSTSPARIKEEVVTHHARQFGESKYGISRTFRVILDLLSVYFFLRYKSRPGHFFGKIGFIFGALGSGILGYLFYVKVFLDEDIGTRPLLMIGVLFVVVAVQFFTTGVLSELVARTYFESSNTHSYIVRNQEAVANVSDADWKRPV